MNDGERLSLLRVIDVNANRAAEGLRVIEEFARFVLEDAHLARLLKELRHTLRDELATIDYHILCVARETQQDIGTSIATSTEFARASSRDVAVASQKRVEQALRCLEEFLKPLDPLAAGRVEQLRYRAYTLARAIEITATSRQRLAAGRLYVLIDGRKQLAEFRDLVSRLVSAGVSLLQLRDKRLSDRDLLERARELRAATAGTETLFIMNDRPDLALLSRADGVHVGQDELRVKDVRQLLGADRLVGVSTHNIAQARSAVLDGADYLGCGPTFPSSTKQFETLAGLAFLREVAAEIRLPAFAIGGIGLGNLTQVRETGFERIAVSAAVAEAPDPAAAAGDFLRQLGS